MWLDEEKPISKQDVVLEMPFVNTAGSLGFYPNPNLMPFLPHLGAFITNPISFRSRQPAKNRRYLPYSGGFLLHTGLQNPGIHRAIARFKKRWENAPLPVIVPLLAEEPNSLAGMVRELESLENILAVELGLPPDCSPTTLGDFLIAASGELPAIVCLSPEQIPVLLATLADLHPAAVHLVSPRGALPSDEGEIITGRLYGPAIFPRMLQSAKTLVDAGLRVVADGGINAHWQAEALLDAGVMAVGLGSVLWQINPGGIFTDNM